MIVSFGEWLKSQRNGRGLTQKQLAQQIGCATITLRKIESEERRPSAQIVQRISKVFHIPQKEQTAFLRFARGDWTQVPARMVDDSPWHASDTATRSNLPASPTSFIGRQQETAKVREYLLDPHIRLITLIGPPGIGKTRLSLAAAQEVISNFPEGTFFVALAPVETSSLIPLTVVQTLGFAETELKSPLEQLKNGIGDKHMLIVLDNLEHVIDEAALLVSDLLSACPRLKILTTSREALRVPGEWIYPVPTLKLPTDAQLSYLDIVQGSQYAALTLFVERARAVRPDFALTADNLQTVAAICTQLDGLPLAIELIAARIRWMSPQALLAKMNDQFILSADGMRAVPARQKTLYNAINWSYNLLPPEEQNLFVRLSAFSSGFTLDAAEAIFSHTITIKPVIDLIALLADKSLLQRTLDFRGELRFNMLVTIQQFAMEHLRHLGKETETRDQHLAYFLDFAEQADKQVHGLDQANWLNLLEMELNNFRSAIDWCISTRNTESVLRLFGALGWAWFVQSHHVEAYSWFNKIRNLPGIANYPELYARILNQIGIQGWLLGDYQNARSVLEESQEIWLKLGNIGEQGLAEALHYLGMILLWDDRDIDSAQSLFQQSFALYEKHADQRGMAFTTLGMGKAEDDRNSNHLALFLLEKSLDLFRQLGDQWGIGRSCLHLGQHYFIHGNHERAFFFLDQYLMVCKELHFSQGITTAMIFLGHICRLQGDFDQAEQILEDSLAISYQLDLNESRALGVGGLGLVALGRSDYQLAAQYARDAYNIRHSLHKGWSTLDLLSSFAAIAAGMNQFERAAKLQGAAQTLASALNLQSGWTDPVEDGLIQTARQQLGSKRFEDLATEGCAMSLEQAVEYALEN